MAGRRFEYDSAAPAPTGPQDDSVHMREADMLLGLGGAAVGQQLDGRKRSGSGSVVGNMEKRPSFEGSLSGQRPGNQHTFSLPQHSGNNMRRFDGLTDMAELGSGGPESQYPDGQLYVDSQGHIFSHHSHPHQQAAQAPHPHYSISVPMSSHQIHSHPDEQQFDYYQSDGYTQHAVRQRGSIHSSNGGDHMVMVQPMQSVQPMPMPSMHPMQMQAMQHSPHLHAQQQHMISSPMQSHPLHMQPAPMHTMVQMRQPTESDFAASLMSLASASTAQLDHEQEPQGLINPMQSYLRRPLYTPIVTQHPLPQVSYNVPPQQFTTTSKVVRPKREWTTSSSRSQPEDMVAFPEALVSASNSWTEEEKRRHSAQWFRDLCFKKWNLSFCPHDSCLTNFASTEELVEHILTHEARDQTKCLYCNYVQAQNVRKHKLRTHLQRHFHMPFRCQCGMTYAQREGYHKHLRKRLGESGHGPAGFQAGHNAD